MVENMGPRFGSVDDFVGIFEAAQTVGLHLDVGHANMGRGRGQPNQAAELMAAFGARLTHVHLHDNDGILDLHLPLGTGTVDWPLVVRQLKAVGWDGTATLEVFAAERRYLDVSRALWREWWAASEGERPSVVEP